tara:strand:+ start:891 stop:1364 length:474 start_codon:yes stop_codon:yes gene_type:complete
VNIKFDLTIGAEIGSTSIKLCYLDENGYFLDQKELGSPELLTPGAVTVELCQYFESLNQTHLINSFGISLPAFFDSEYRIVKKSNLLKDWIDVPFADWMEIRLGTGVILANTRECELFGMQWSEISNFSKDLSFASIGVARLAHQKNMSNLAPFKAG